MEITNGDPINVPIFGAKEYRDEFLRLSKSTQGNFITCCSAQMQYALDHYQSNDSFDIDVAVTNSEKTNVVLAKLRIASSLCSQDLFVSIMRFFIITNEEFAEILRIAQDRKNNVSVDNSNAEIK
jgi:uncharacterized protein YehS (DUF1456 family)